MASITQRHKSESEEEFFRRVKELNVRKVIKAYSEQALHAAPTAGRKRRETACSHIVGAICRMFTKVLRQ